MTNKANSTTLALTLRIYHFLQDNPQGSYIGFPQSKSRGKSPFGNICTEINCQTNAAEKIVAFLKALGLVYEEYVPANNKYTNKKCVFKATSQKEVGYD